MTTNKGSLSAGFDFTLLCLCLLLRCVTNYGRRLMKFNKKNHRMTESNWSKPSTSFVIRSNNIFSCTHSFSIVVLSLDISCISINTKLMLPFFRQKYSTATSRSRSQLLVVFLITWLGKYYRCSAWTMDRRSYLLNQILLPQLLQVTDVPSQSTSSSSQQQLIDGMEITDRVFLDLRIARQDGSTYIRDDLPDTFENRVITARIVLGLFGRQAPNHVKNFLSYVVPPKDDDVANPPVLNSSYPAGLSIAYVGISCKSLNNSRVASSKMTEPKIVCVASKDGSARVVIPKLGVTSKVLCVNNPLEVCDNLVEDRSIHKEAGNTRDP